MADQAAVRAMFGVTAQGRSAAGLDGAHHPALGAIQVSVMSLAIGRTVAAEHIRHLQGSAHGRRSAGWHDLQSQTVQRAGGATDHGCRHLGIARRGRQVAVS